MTKIVIYEGNDEILITPKKYEAQFLIEFPDRNFAEDYERYETKKHSPFISIYNSSHVKLL